MKKPNILIFNPDEMRADVLGHLGNLAGVTPNMDAFVQTDAVSYADAFCQNPVCVPSRCSFFTGLYPHVLGHRTMEHTIDIHGEVKPMFQELKEDGYYVWMNYRNDFIPNNDVDAFNANADETFIPRGPIVRHYPVDHTVHPSWSDTSFIMGIIPEASEHDPDRDGQSIERAKAFIRNRPQDQPFCAFIGLFNPHPPYGVEQKYFDAVDPKLVEQRIPEIDDTEKMPSMLRHIKEQMDLHLSDEDWKTMRRIYLAMCLKVDQWFGELVQVLKEEGIYDDTDIYILSDHGDFAGDYGLPEKNQNTFEDCLTRVPLIVKPHKEIEAVPGIRHGLCELVDFYATVMDLSQTAPTHWHFGRSLRENLKDPSQPLRMQVFCEGGRLKNEAHCMEHAVFVLPQYEPRLGGQKDDIKHTKATMIRTEKYKYVRRLYESDELYDLVLDPMERHNVIDCPQYSQVLAELRMAMLEWYQQTCDIVPLYVNGRSGSPMGTLIDRYVGSERKDQMAQKAAAGGFTLREFENWCKSEGDSEKREAHN